MDDPIDYRELFEGAPCGYLVLEPNGRIVVANRTLQIWLGFAESEILGKRLLDLLNVAGRIFYETHFAPLLRMQGQFHEVALDLVRRDGSRLPVLANAVQARNNDGEVAAVRLALFQAVERRRYERELVDAQRESSEAREELAKLNRKLTETGLLRDEFIAVLGHDLRNPLASIRGGMTILSRESLSERGRQVVALTERSIDRMNALIGDVLDLARGRLGGGLQLTRDSKESLGPVLELVAAELMSATGREVRTDVDLPLPVAADSSRIAQLASNLLGNAIAHGSQDKPIKFRAWIENGVLALSVSNEGNPIPPATLERLFQPFFRGGDPAGNHNGLGLGLHIASEIAKAHGGQLTVASDASETVFTFRMPV